MNTKVLNNILNIVTILVVTMFFSCNNNLGQVHKIGISENEPIGVDCNMNVKYNDSGWVSANLISV